MRTLLHFSLAVLLFAFAGQVAAGGDSAPNADIQRLLGKRIDVDFDRMDVRSALAQLAERVPDLDIVLDSAVEDHRPDRLKYWAGFSGRGLPVAEVLTLICRTGLSWSVSEGRVRVTLPNIAASEVSTARYPMGALVDHRQGKYARGIRPGRLVEVIQDLVDLVWGLETGVAEWGREGGPAGMRLEGDDLVVTQTRAGHERVAEVLATLSRGLGVESPVTLPERPASIREALAETRRALERPVDLNFHHTPLDAALEYLREIRRDVNLIVDPALAGYGLDLSLRFVYMEAKDLPLKTALEPLLGPELAYQTRPGYVLITIREILHTELLLRAYEVEELGGTPFWELRDIIFRMVNNMSDIYVAPWTDEGGPAAITFVRGLMLVTQTEKAHEKIERCLGTLRMGMAIAVQQPSVLRLPFSPIPLPEDPRTAETRRRLETKVAVDLDDVSVLEALGVLARQKPELNFVVDLNCLPPPAEVFRSHVSLSRKSASRRAVLEELIGEVRGLYVGPGYAEVASWEKAHANLSIVLYPIYDLVSGGGMGPDELDDIVRSTVNQEFHRDVAAWTDEGGPAASDYWHGVLIVQQTEEGQRQTAALIRNLRRQAREAASALP